MALCSVCVGTGLLLGDSCPLCEGNTSLVLDEQVVRGFGEVTVDGARAESELGGRIRPHCLAEEGRRDPDDEDSLISTTAALTNTQRRRARRLSAADHEMVALEEQLAELAASKAKADEEITRLREDCDLAQNTIKSLSRQINEDKLRRLQVLGKVMEERRQRNVASSDEEDENFVAGKTCFASGYSSEEDFASEEDEEEDAEQVDAAEEGEEDEIQEESDDSIDVSVEVRSLQNQMNALLKLRSLDCFQRVVAGALQTKIDGILNRASDACEAFADAYDAKAIQAWTMVLQRILGEAVTALFPHVKSVILETTQKVRDEITVTEYNHVVWKALAWHDRCRLLSSTEYLGQRASVKRGTYWPEEQWRADAKIAGQKSHIALPFLSELDVDQLRGVCRGHELLVQTAIESALVHK